MPIIVAGTTGVNTLNAITPTQVALSNGSRQYGMLVNLDSINGVWFAFGTNNGATRYGCMFLGPRRFYEMTPGRVLQGDLSCIADAVIAAQPTPLATQNLVSWHEE